MTLVWIAIVVLLIIQVGTIFFFYGVTKVIDKEFEDLRNHLYEKIKDLKEFINYDESFWMQKIFDKQSKTENKK